MSAPERTEAEMAERIAAFEAAPAAPESWTGSEEATRLRISAYDGYPDPMSVSRRILLRAADRLERLAAYKADQP